MANNHELKSDEFNNNYTTRIEAEMLLRNFLKYKKIQESLNARRKNLDNVKVGKATIMQLQNEIQLSSVSSFNDSLSNM